MKKGITKAIVLILCITMVIQYLPLSGFKAAAASISGNSTNIVTTGSAVTVTSNSAETVAMGADKKSVPTVEGEDIARREECVKHFRMSDGSYQAVAYSNPVHYLDKNKKYVDINNNLIPTTVDDKAYYKNAANNVNVLLPKTLNDNSSVYISKDNKTVGWKLNTDNQANANITKKPMLLQAENTRKLAVCTSSAEKIEVENQYKEEPKKDQAQIKYDDVFQDVDVQYNVIGKTVKESIILNNETDQNEFSFDLSCGNMDAVLQEDNSVAFYNNGSTKKVYTIDAPYMFDANRNSSNDIKVTLDKTENGYKYTIIPSAEWLHSSKTVYPVTIDPTVTPVSTSENVKSTTAVFANEYHSDPIALDSDKNCLKAGRFQDFEVGMLLYVKMPSQIPVTARITDAKMDLTFSRGTFAESHLNVYDVTSDWNQTDLNNNPILYEQTYKTPAVPRYDNVPIDNVGVGTFDNWKVHFNITRAAQRWANGRTNYGVMVKAAYLSPDNNMYIGFYGAGTAEASNAPKFVFSYRDTAGLEDYWSYEQQSVGNAGTGYINDFNGNLVFVHKDVETVGELPTVNVSHVYNSDLASSSQYSMFGKGWRLNVIQQLFPTDSTLFPKNPYVYIDGDGTEHYFYNDNGTLKDEDGLGMTITQQSSDTGERKIQLKDKTVLVFNKNGYLINTIDKNGNKIIYTYAGANCLRYIDDANGNRITFDYCDPNCFSADNLLASITDNSTGRVTKFEYSGYPENLIGITHSDSTSCTYMYDDSGPLAAAKDNSKNYMMTYRYEAANQFYRVIWAQEHIFVDNMVRSSGSDLHLSYNLGNSTTVEDDGADGNYYSKGDNNKTTYQFDNDGQPVTVYDEDGNASSYKYNTGNGKQHQLSVSGSTQKSVVNYVNNPSFDALSEGDLWANNTSGSTTMTRDTTTGYIGATSMKVTKAASAGIGGVYQDISGLAPGKYTLSAYVKASGIVNAGKNTGASIYAYQYANDTLIKQDVCEDYVTGTTSDDFNHGWQRINLTFDVASNATKIQIFGGIYNTAGTAWFDGFQLESGDAPNKFNIINNPGFQGKSLSVMNYWHPSKQSLVLESVIGHTGSETKTAKFPGDLSKDSNIYQDVNVSGDEGDVYLLSGWAKAASLLEDESDFSMVAEVSYDTGDPIWYHFDFNKSITDWQYTSGVIATDDNDNSTHRHYTSIRIYIYCTNQVNPAYFDDIQLIKDDGASYTYDDKGNLITSKTATDNAKFKYDSNSQITNMVNSTGNSFNCSYDAKGNCTHAETNEGVKADISYDSQGNATSAKVSGAKRTPDLVAGQKYYIRQKLSGNCLDVDCGADRDNQQAVQNIWDSYNSEQWQLKDNGDGYYSLISCLGTSQRALDISGASTSNGALAIVHPQNGGSNQEFLLKYISDGGYEIIAKHTNDTKALTNSSNSFSYAADVTLQPITGDDNQIWYFDSVEKMNNPVTPAEGNTYAIQSLYNGQYVEATDSSTAVNADVKQNFHQNAKNQLFKIIKSDEADYYYLEPQNAPGMVLALNLHKFVKNGRDTYCTICTQPVSTTGIGKMYQKIKFVRENNSYALKFEAGSILSITGTSHEPGAVFSSCPSEFAGVIEGLFVLEEPPKQTAEMTENVSTAYNDKGTKIVSTTDEIGTKTSNTYDSNNRLLTGATVGSGTNAQTTNYTYNDDDMLTSVSSGAYADQYTYTNQRLSKIAHNGFDYGIAYNDYGDLTSMSVGNQRLFSNTFYDSHSVNTTTYANGDQVKYLYGKKYKITGVSYGKNNAFQTAVSYQYDSLGDLTKSIDMASGVTMQYHYDLLNRLTDVTANDGTKYYVSYDSKNRVNITTSKVADTTTKNEYVYDGTSKITRVKLNGNPIIGYNYDPLLRVDKRILYLAKNYTTKYQYVNSSSGTTPLISRIEDGNDALNYTYDPFGNIIKVVEDNEPPIIAPKEAYTYDSHNQLTSEVKWGCQDEWDYTYDNGGNITSVTYDGSKRNYEYADPNWKDKLTAYEGQKITYDEVGNPLQYRDGMKFTWKNGKELSTATTSQHSCTYTYNTDGVRTSKTVDGVTTHYYILDGVLLGEKTGNNTIIYLYDDGGNRYGIIYNGLYYYYVFNAQGDVIGILDSSGNKVVTYDYNAWGSPCGLIYDSTSNHIGTINPIRYRGYYYDTETGFYYLQARYYDPTTCRFINADDSINLSDNIIDSNLFAYCNNNPVTRVDEDGTRSKKAKHYSKKAVNRGAKGFTKKAAKSSSKKPTQGKLPKWKYDYMSKIYTRAQKDQKKTKIPAGIMTMQCCWESTWGINKHTIGQNNYFGVKGNGPGGYQSYDSFDDSVNDYEHFMTTKKCYKQLFKLKTTKEWAYAIGPAGYAPDNPKYGDNLWGSIQAHNLE